MTTIELTKTKGPYGDECYSYTFTTTKEHYTIQELIGAARRNTPEWGHIEAATVAVDDWLEENGYKNSTYVIQTL